MTKWADQDLIIYCNITLLHEEVKKGKKESKEIALKEIVAKNIGDTFWHRRLSEYKITEPLKVIKVEIIKELGYANKQD